MLIPAEFQLRQLHNHLIQHSWQREAFRRLQREAVPHCDQTQVHHQSIVGGGGLRDDDERSLQPDVHGQTESLLGEVSNTGRCPLCRLSRGGAKSFFSHLEVVDKHLKNSQSGVRSPTPPARRKKDFTETP